METMEYINNPSLLAGGAVTVVLLGAFLFVLRSLVFSRKDRPAGFVLPDVRTERYRPMVRLLSQDDLAFLKDQAGYTPELGRRLMEERRRLMKAYLRALDNDFQAIYSAATQLLVLAPTDQPELAAELSRQRVEFFKGMFMARLNLRLNAFGIGEVRVASLVSALQVVEGQFNHLTNIAAARSLA